MKCTDLRVGRIGPLRCQRSHMILVAGVVVGKAKNKEPVERTKKCSVKILLTAKVLIHNEKAVCMYVV